MIKNIAYFPSQCARNATEPLNAFLDACNQHGITPLENSWTADAVVIWSVLWQGKMSANEKVYHHYREQGRPVIVIDIGALRRGQTWKVAVNNINAEGFYGHTSDLDWDRPKKLGLSLGNVQPNNPAILIAAQNTKSLQVQHLAKLESWITEQVNKLKVYTDRPIVIRPHPRSSIDRSLLPPSVSIEHPVHVAGTYDNFDLKFDYHALINYNSGPGVQAAIQGCPVTVDHTSLAYPVSIHIEDIEKRPSVDRHQWFVEICHTEYTTQEIRQGLWLKRIATEL